MVLQSANIISKDVQKVVELFNDRLFFDTHDMRRTDAPENAHEHVQRYRAGYRLLNTPRACQPVQR